MAQRHGLGRGWHAGRLKPSLVLAAGRAVTGTAILRENAGRAGLNLAPALVVKPGDGDSGKAIDDESDTFVIWNMQ